MQENFKPGKYIIRDAEGCEIQDGTPLRAWYNDLRFVFLNVIMNS